MSDYSKGRVPRALPLGIYEMGIARFFLDNNCGLCIMHNIFFLLFKRNFFHLI
jgi:hypothetical protein